MKKTIKIFVILMCLTVLLGFSKNVLAEETFAKEIKAANIKSTNILFIGNSKTLYNRIPNKFKGLATVSGKNVKVSVACTAGKNLKEIIKFNRKKIIAEPFDYAIIQVSSYDLLKSDSLLKTMTSLKKTLRKKNPKIKIFLRQTWYRDNDDSEMIKTVNRTISYISKKLKFTIIFDGDAIRVAKKILPKEEFFWDERHQSDVGAYLIACCIYKKVFKESPAGLKDTFEDPNKELLQNIANTSKYSASVKNKTVYLKKGSKKNLSKIILKKYLKKGYLFNHNPRRLKIENNVLTAQKTGKYRLSVILSTSCLNVQIVVQ